MFAILFAWYRPEEKRRNVGFGLPRKQEKNSRKNPFFLFFGLFVSHFLREAETCVFPISGRRPEFREKVPGKDDEKVYVIFLSLSLV